MAIAKKSTIEKGEVEEKKVSSKTAQPVKKGALLNPANEFIIKYPLITEKAYHMSAKGQYVFVVDKHTNKVEVRKAIRKIYNVDPISVNTVTIRGERQKYKGVDGKKVTLKKAIVTLKKGQKLDIMPS